MKRLFESSGSVDQSPVSQDASDKIVRSAILVHAGDGGEPIEFQSGDGPIHFDEARIKNVVDVHNKNLEKLASEYGGEDKIPMGAYQPILDSHENDSNDRIVGRLTGRLKFELRDVPKVGKKVPCAIAEGITFLGADACKKVADGRIYHLSIGINEADDSLGETSTVITPAAPGAMLLKKQAGSHLKNEERKQMSTLRLKRYAAHVEKMSKLTAMKEEITKLSSKLVGTQETVKLAAKKDGIVKRLHAVMASGKMTPAEFKELSKTTEGFAHLAKLDDDTLKIALSPFEARQERVIEPGQRGSTEGVNFGDMAQSLEKKQMKNLSKETKKELSRLSGKKLFAEDKDQDEDHGKDHEMAGSSEDKPFKPEKDDHVVAGEEKLSAHLAEMGKHLAAGDLDKAKQAHADCLAAIADGGAKHLEIGDVKSEDYQKGLGEVQKQVDELNTQMSRFAGMVSELMGDEEKEGSELSKRMGKEEEEEAAAEAKKSAEGK